MPYIILQRGTWVFFVLFRERQQKKVGNHCTIVYLSYSLENIMAVIKN